MKGEAYHLILLLIIYTTSAEEIDLPLCPTNIQFFPQNLPLHCKMPPNAKVVKFPVPPPMPIPGPQQGLPMMPPPFPGPMPISGPFPGPMAVPGPFPAPMPIPASPSAKLPVIVMPFYSPDPAFKTQKPSRPRPTPLSTGSDTDRRFYTSSDTDTDTDTSSDTDTSYTSDTSSSSDTSSERGIWRGNKKKWKKGWKRGYKKGFKRNARRFNRQHKARRRHHKRDPITPLLQYVTKDGYVIFEKKISNGEAKDWLNEQRVVDDKIIENRGVTPKDVQVRVSTKGNDENNEMYNFNIPKLSKNKHMKIVELNADKNMDYENKKPDRTISKKAVGNKNNNDNRDDYSDEVDLEEQKRKEHKQLDKARAGAVNKRAAGKPKRRSKPNKT